MTKEREYLDDGPRCRDCADGDGFCDIGGKNCGFPKGHPLYQSRPYRDAGRAALTDAERKEK